MKQASTINQEKPISLSGGDVAVAQMQQSLGNFWQTSYHQWTPQSNQVLDEQSMLSLIYQNSLKSNSAKKDSAIGAAEAAAINSIQKEKIKQNLEFKQSSIDTFIQNNHNENAQNSWENIPAKKDIFDKIIDYVGEKLFGIEPQEKSQYEQVIAAYIYIYIYGIQLDQQQFFRDYTYALFDTMQMSVSYDAMIQQVLSSSLQQAPKLMNYLGKGGTQAVDAASMAKSWQGTGAYPEVDDWTNVSINKGTKIWVGAPGQSNFYTTEKVMQSIGNDATKLNQGLQVGKGNYSQFRPGMTQYVVTQDITVGYLKALANPQYGTGGFDQYFVPDYDSILNPVKSIIMTNR